jgi:hypothetical protein
LLQKNDSLYSIPSGSFELEHLPNGSPHGLGQFSPSLDFKAAPRRSSFSRNRADELSTVDPFTAPTQAGELFSATPRCGKPVLVSFLPSNIDFRSLGFLKHMATTLAALRPCKCVLQFRVEGFAVSYSISTMEARSLCYTATYWS